VAGCREIAFSDTSGLSVSYCFIMIHRRGRGGRRERQGWLAAGKLPSLILPDSLFHIASSIFTTEGTENTEERRVGFIEIMSFPLYLN